MTKKQNKLFKPLLYTTTVRNPERVKFLLYIISKYESSVLTDDLAEEIMGEVIRFGLYRPMKKSREAISAWRGTEPGKLGNEILSDGQVKVMLDLNPQSHKEAGFSYGWPSRFATVFDFSKELGFVYFKPNEMIVVSEIGKRLASSVAISVVDNLILYENVHPEYEQQVFLHAMAKSQRNNPFVRVLNDNIPLILLLQVIQKLNSDPETSDAGISVLELPLVIFWKNNDSDELYKRIKTLRSVHGYTPSWEVIIDICINEIMEGEYKKFKPKSIMTEYPDEFIRKMRLTGLITLRGGGRFVDINKFEQKKVDYVLKTYSKYVLYNDEIEYFKYMATEDPILLEESSHKPEIIESNILLDKWVTRYTWNQIKEELTTVSNRGLTQDSILKLLSHPVRLEFLTAIAVKSNFPDTKVVPNYPYDDEGIPTSTASGVGNQGDIECFEGENGILLEVTMSEGVQQTKMEIWPISRHLEVFSQKNVGGSVCYFIAPSIFKDSERQISFVRQTENINIIPFTIKNFIESLEKQSTNKSDFYKVCN